MTWTLIETRQPATDAEIPDPKAVSFSTKQLNSVVTILVFEKDGVRREVPLTVMMMHRAEKLGFDPKHYAARLLEFDRLVAA